MGPGRPGTRPPCTPAKNVARWPITAKQSRASRRKLLAQRGSGIRVQGCRRWGVASVREDRRQPSAGFERGVQLRRWCMGLHGARRSRVAAGRGSAGARTTLFLCRARRSRFLMSEAPGAPRKRAGRTRPYSLRDASGGFGSQDGQPPFLPTASRKGLRCRKRVGAIQGTAKGDTWWGRRVRRPHSTSASKPRRTARGSWRRKRRLRGKSPAGRMQPPQRDPSFSACAGPFASEGPVLPPLPYGWHDPLLVVGSFCLRGVLFATSAGWSPSVV